MTITQDSSAPLFVVIGSTGNQGTSVINALKADDRAYRVRAVTRDVSKDAAKERAAWGCEVVAADITGENAVETLTKVFAGAEYAFAMTMPGFARDGVTDAVASEFAEGKNQVDAAKAAGVKTLVWAGLPSFTKITGGKYPTAHFDAKAKVTEYARTLEGPGFKVYDVQPSGYVSNYLGMLAPRKGPDGTYIITSLVENPPHPQPIIDLEADYGHYVLGAIKSGKLDTVLAASEYIDGKQLTDALEKVSGGKTVKTMVVPVAAFYEPVKQYRGELAAQNVVNMLLAVSEFGYWGGADLAESNAILARPARTFEQAVLANKDKFEKVFA